jgi:uncharacterized membrane protein
MVFQKKHRVSDKNKLIIILIASFVLFNILWFIGDAYTQWTYTANPWLVLLVYLFANPSNWVMTYLLFEKYHVIGIISGVLIAITSDIVSLPHVISKIGVIPVDPTLASFNDYSFYVGLSHKLFSNGWFGSWFTYAIIAEILFAIAILIILIVTKKPKQVIDTIKIAG